MSTFAVCLPNFNLSNLSSNGFSIYGNLNYNIPIAQNIPASDLLPPPNGNCPLIINLPQGTTQIIVIDQCTGPIDTAAIFNPVDIAVGTLSTDCCYAIIDIPEVPLPWCDECELEFDTFSTTTVGKIIAGNLLSSCGPVTHYTIGWYKDGDYSAPELISGYGTSFNNFQFVYPFQHPLTGNSSPLVPAGDYEGIIHDVVINGVMYSSVSGSGGGIPIPFESCFDTVVVDPLDCNNGISPGKYSHQITFNSQAVGTTSAPVSTTYVLDPSTQYFAFAFKAFNVWDEIEIKWISGDPSVTSNPSLYSQPIYLEKLRVGGDANIPQSPSSLYSSIFSATNNNPTLFNINNLWPKRYETPYYFQRVLTLTNLETSSNPSLPDFLEITITPNPSNNNTSWNAGFQCLDTFDCSTCVWDDYPNNLPKIWKLHLIKDQGCDKQLLSLFHTGCFAPSSDWMGYDVENYGMSNPNINLIGSFYDPTSNFLPGAVLPAMKAPAQGWLSLGALTSCNNPQYLTVLGCGSSSTGTITLNKTPQQIELIFNLESDYLYYKNNLINEAFNYYGGILFNQPSPIPCTLINGVNPYYTTFKLAVPIPSNLSPNTNCGDNTIPVEYQFNSNDYFNIDYIENPSNNFWSITIPQTLLVNCSPPSSPCNGCYNAVADFVNNYNSSINNSSTFSYTTIVGSKYSSPFLLKSIIRSSTGGISGSICIPTKKLNQWYPWYSINTIPFISGSTGWVNLPSLGASLPCDIIPYPMSSSNTIGTIKVGTMAEYQVRFPSLTGSFDPLLSTNDFEIYALAGYGPTGSSSYPNGQAPSLLPCPVPSNLGALIYSYIGGVSTVYTSSHFHNGVAPILIIDPPV